MLRKTSPENWIKMNKDTQRLKVFGYGLALLCGFISWRLFVKSWGAGFPLILAGTGVALTGLTAVRVAILIPFYQKWMIAVRAIGTVLSTVVLMLIFYGVFGIIGLVLRALRKDLLSLRIDPECQSYWRQREQPQRDRQTYLQQF